MGILTMKQVSIIIPVHAEPKWEKCLSQIQAQTCYSDIEVIPIFGQGFPAEKRNKGFRESHGNFVLFLDDDEYLAKETVSACLNKFNEGYDIVGIRERRIPQKSWFAKCMAVWQSPEVVERKTFFRRQVLDDVGLFNEDAFLVDDTDLFFRAIEKGYKYGVARHGFILHDETMILLTKAQKVLWSRKSGRQNMISHGINKFVDSDTSQENRGVISERKRIFKELIKKPELIFGTLLIGYIYFFIRRLP